VKTFMYVKVKHEIFFRRNWRIHSA
jgi:hypothetical protein